jgi:hypothetical protein
MDTPGMTFLPMWAQTASFRRLQIRRRQFIREIEPISAK